MSSILANQNALHKLETQLDKKIADIELRIGEVQCISKNWRCPTSDSHYKVINGSCLYFETTPMNYSDAQSNCRNKYGDNTGRLFEPHSQTPQRTLHEEAIKHDSEPIWIGISPGMKNSPGHVKSNSFLSYFWI